MTNKAQMHVEGENIQGFISFLLENGRVSEVTGIDVILGIHKFCFDADAQLKSIKDQGWFPSMFDIPEGMLLQAKEFAEHTLSGFKIIHLNNGS